MDNATLSRSPVNLYLYNSNNIIYTQTAFLHMFGKMPHTIQLKQINYASALKWFKQQYAHVITQDISNNTVYANKKGKGEELAQHLFILDKAIIVDIGEYHFEIYYAPETESDAMAIKKGASAKKEKPVAKPEIYILAKENYGFEITGFEINKTKLDIGLYYEDDFKETDAVIQKQLNRKNGKGIVLLHGTPGTGKTTYLRYLVGKLRKKVIFMPPAIAGQLSNPDLVKLLVENPDSVLIIEDAENIIMQRQAGLDSSVSNLLNISDGLLSDFLNVQLICTFNSAISSVDNALLRKGRLIAKYEFGKLSVAKAQRLSDKLGYNKTIMQPMTVAEIVNQDVKSHEPEKHIIGFRTGAKSA